MADFSNKIKELEVGGSQPFKQFLTGSKLNLSGLALTDKDIPAIIQFLHHNPEIKEIDLSLNHIGDLGISDFAERNMTVVHANFLGNIITDHGIAIFASKNQSVIHANFSHNLISDKGVYQFARKNQICLSSKFSTVQYH